MNKIEKEIIRNDWSFDYEGEEITNEKTEYGPLLNKDSVAVAKFISRMSTKDANELLKVVTNPHYDPNTISFTTKEQLNQKLETTVSFEKKKKKKKKKKKTNLSS